MRFCPSCGGDLELRQPPGEDRDRHVCAACGTIHYQNPKVVVGSVCTLGSRILICRRAIQPRRGFWTLPAGFLELGETAEEGALREAWEEARARIEIEGLLAVYSVPRIGQVQLLYRARLLDPAVEPGRRAWRSASSAGTRSRGPTSPSRPCAGSSSAPASCGRQPRPSRRSSTRPVTWPMPLAPSEESRMIHRGSCHCGRIAFEVEGELTAAVACNCSICSRKGALLWAVPTLGGPGEEGRGGRPR